MCSPRTPRAYAAALREETPDLSEAEATRALSDLRELLAAPGVRVEMDQTTLIRDTLDVAMGIEDVLCLRQWELAVAPADCQFVTSDDPVALELEPGATPSFLNSPGFGRRDTFISFVLGPRHLIIGYAHEPAVRRRDFTREQVAGYNTRAVFQGVRFVYFGGDSFEFLGPNGELATGPAEVLRRAET